MTGCSLTAILVHEKIMEIETGELNMREDFQFVPIHQLAEKFPEDSWWSTSYKDFDDESLVAYYEGDLTLPLLDLDWDMSFPQHRGVTLIFINGNLTVDALYNEETDGAVGLIVAGNINAKNIAVGGQELYVIGDVIVEEIVCGSYNHGEMIVKGNLYATALVEDDYHFKIDGQQSLVCKVDVWDKEGICQGLPVDMQAILIDDVFLEPEEGEVDFAFDLLVSTIKEGHSALRDLRGVLTRQKEATLYFMHNTINEENIEKLVQCILMKNDQLYFDFEENGIYFKVQREHVDTDGDWQKASVYIETAANCYFIYAEQPISLLHKTTEEGAEWTYIEQLPELSEYWAMLLTCINIAELYLPTIEVSYMQELLQHPIIEALDPYGEDNDGFWDGSKYYRFRRDGYTDEEGYYFAPRIDIQTQDGAFYFYTWDNERYISRYYQPVDGDEAEDISFLDVKHWEASERYFNKFKEFIAGELEH